MPVHITSGKQLSGNAGMNTCIINKVRIRVDVFGKGKRKRKGLLILFIAIYSQSSLFSITTGEFKKEVQ